MELFSKRGASRAGTGLDLVIVDYLQLMRDGRKKKLRAVAIGAISRGGLKILARIPKIPVIALAQLSPQGRVKRAANVQLSDLRESGSIERDADMVWFVDRVLPFAQRRKRPKRS